MSRLCGYLGEKYFREGELQCKGPVLTVPGVAHLASEDQRGGQCGSNRGNKRMKSRRSGQRGNTELNHIKLSTIMVLNKGNFTPHGTFVRLEIAWLPQ